MRTPSYPESDRCRRRRRFRTVAALFLLLPPGCASEFVPGDRPPATDAVSTASVTDVGRASSPSPSPEQTESAAAARSPLAGRSAPDFSLPDDAGKSVRLADFRGRWVVLYFYPQGDTPGCTCEATEFTQLLQDFNDLNAAVVGVSPDSPASLAYFRKKYDLRLNLLSDPDRTVARQYGAAHAFTLGTDTPDPKDEQTIRTTYLIDPAGKIAYHWPEVIPEGHAARVRDRLATLAGAGSPSSNSGDVPQSAPGG